MPDPPKHIDGPTLASSSQPARLNRRDAGSVNDVGRHGHFQFMTGLNNEYLSEGGRLPTTSSHFSQQVDTLSQLPTPRTHSPANVLPYFPGVVGSPESPLAYAHTRVSGGGPASTSRIHPRQNSPRNELERSSSRLPQTVTPGASPVNLGALLTKRPVSAPPLPSAVQEHRIIVKAESPPILAPAYDISIPRSATSKPGSPEVHSLSSPFIEKGRVIQATAGHAAPSGGHPIELLSPQPISYPVPATELFSPVHIVGRQSSAASLDNFTLLPAVDRLPDRLPLSTEGERTRQPAGEPDRIHNHKHMSSEEIVRSVDLENCRPDFFRRVQRGDNVDPSGPTAGEGSNEKDSLGITTSPVKGRRLQLFDFQKTSEESFEESLMTHGYGTYGEPRTPQRPITAADGRSQEAMKWLAYNTPTAPSTARQPQLEHGAGPTEKELKKRKRLEAFKGSTARACAKLFTAEIEGVGRVLLDVPPEDVDAILGSPAKKRATGKKKKSGKEHEEEVEARNSERLKWIERYFSQDSDTDEFEAGGEEEAPPPTWEQAYEEPSTTSRSGRGKRVPLQVDPGRQRVLPQQVAPALESQKSRSILFPSDPADARTALMSKRSVRLLAQRRLRQNGMRSASLHGVGEGRLACQCGRDEEDDGRPAVQCDECYNWYHLECIGVRDESELGDEDDPWFCSICRPQIQASTSNLSITWGTQRQPTFVPTEERPVHTSARNDIAFYSSSSPLSGTLHTPTQGQGRSHESEFFRRSIWDDPHTGPGPSTPMSRGVRVLTPGFAYGEYGHDHMGVYDTFMSPSRSIFSSGQKSGTSYTTPKNTNVSQVSGGSILGLPWSSRPGGLFTTPSSRTRQPNPGSIDYGGYGQEESAPFSTHFEQNTRANVMYAADDTPIRRAPTKETRPLPPSPPHTSSTVGFGDSPLASRGEWAFVGLGESPVVRSVSVRDKGSDEGSRKPTAKS